MTNQGNKVLFLLYLLVAQGLACKAAIGSYSGDDHRAQRSAAPLLCVSVLNPGQGAKAVDYHHTWEPAKYFEPLIGWLHRTGLFNFYFYVPFMTVVGVLLFIWVLSRVRRTGYLARQTTFIRFFWHSIYFSVSWIAISTFGIALKTMIVEELDYQERKWFEPYLAPTHFYISSAAVAYLILVSRSKRNYFDLALFLYLQIALLAGYAVAGYRVANEDVEGAIGGGLLVLFFLVCNYDLISRVRKSLLAGIFAQRHAHA